MGTSLIACQNSKQKISSLTSYESGLASCLKIKEDNPETGIFLMNDCMVGSSLPTFEAESIEGVKINTELLKGKLTILNFWFTTCPPCIAEIPGFNSIVEKYGKDEINYISIARNNREEIKEFLNNHSWNFTHLANENDIIHKIFKIEFGYPTTYLLNEDAQIIKSFSGGAVGEQAITQIQNKLIPTIEKELN